MKKILLSVAILVATSSLPVEVLKENFAAQRSSLAPMHPASAGSYGLFDNGAHTRLYNMPARAGRGFVGLRREI